VKLFSMETKKYLQHLLALLGTPGTTRVTQAYYASLPYTVEYGAHIVDKSSGQLIEVKSRLEKILKQTIPSHVKDYFFPASLSASLSPLRPVTVSSTQDDGPQGDSPPLPPPLLPSAEDLDFLSNPLTKILLNSLQLDPQKRPTFADLTKMNFFTEQFSLFASPSVTSDSLLDMGKLLEYIR
jgi:serine/threonine protein kinase